MSTQSPRTILCSLASLALTINLFAQPTPQSPRLTQRIRGTVLDGILQRPLSGATVTLTTANRTVLTDSTGNFSLNNVPIGRQSLTVSHVGFKTFTQDNIEVEAGKETVLVLPLESAPTSEKEVVVRAGSRRNKPLNVMSVVSARTFSVEETTKYAAAVNDPLRMATAFAGVFAPNDGNNDISIRGNSPTGLLWRMEGVEIPNPNHFSSPVGTGGGISILSAQLLANSDFLTGAFPAEYGDALSGVFDLRLRKGNNEKNEYTLQGGVLGLDVGAEGPLASKKGSYLIDYRYSTLGLLQSLGFNVSQGTTNFQDLSYNVVLPAGKAGNFSLFGFGGISTQNFTPKLDSSKWKNDGDRYSQSYSGTTAMTGLSHTILIDGTTSLHSVLAVSYTNLHLGVNYVQNDYSNIPDFSSTDKTPKWTFTSNMDHRLGNGGLLRSGFIIDLIHFNYSQSDRQSPIEPYTEQVNATGNTQTVQGYAEWQDKRFGPVQFDLGLHYLELLLNHSRSLEPRASVKYELSHKSSLALGYGLHSQIQQLGVYFAEDTNATGALYRPNQGLGLTKSHQVVLSYSYALGHNLNLKTELYYQYLFNVPVNAYDTSTFSTLNILNGGYVSDPLVNKGTGRNYGIEITLEKYLSNNLYYIVNGSLYQSKYAALDGVERNTRFNGNYLFNAVAGKDFTSNRHGKTRTFGVNVKVIWAGGYRDTPIDEEQSIQQQKTVYYQYQVYTQQDPAYFRTDLRVSMKKDYRRHLTTTLSLDVQNLTNNKNLYNREYDPFQGKIVSNYQTGLIPVLNYKVEF